MAETEAKMEALKKVYADIILNMAKESSARVLESERRSIGLQQRLSASKEEALSTILRVKSIMDFKIREAEMASVGHIKRIQELEAQLNEAEDIICTLRMELKRVNYELDETKNDGERNGLVSYSSDECHEVKPSSDPVQSSPIGSVVICATNTKNTYLCHGNKEGHHCNSAENATKSDLPKDLSAENDCGSNPTLVSIIMRNKETELYRNGCTQRIRALEQNLLTTRTPTGQSDHLTLNLKSELVASETGNTIKTVTSQSAIVGKVASSQAKSLSELKETSCGNGQATKCSRTISLRKRRGRRGCVKSISSRVFQDPNAAAVGASKKGNPSLSTEMNGSLLNGPVQSDANNIPQVEVLLSDCKLNTNHDAGEVRTEDSGVRGEKTCESNGNVQVGSGKFLKYTFQRKRKRGSLGNNEEKALDEKKSSSKRTDDKHNGSVELTKSRPASAIESPRKDRRLVQVARQLISLSGRRW